LTVSFIILFLLQGKSTDGIRCKKAKMILLKKDFWKMISRISIILIIELAFCICGLIIFLIIYSATGKESFNTYAASIFYKIILTIPPLFYNLNQIIIAHKRRDYYSVFGFVGITVLYCLFVWSLGGGGR
jgi:hypothetical protein